MWYLYLISGSKCPRPGNIPEGQWTCQDQQIPIPETVDGSSALEVYKSKNFNLKI